MDSMFQEMYFDLINSFNQNNSNIYSIKKLILMHSYLLFQLISNINVKSMKRSRTWCGFPLTAKINKIDLKAYQEEEHIYDQVPDETSCNCFEFFFCK